MNTEAKCYKCGSMSVIQDGLTWVCAEHITPCRCDSHGDNFDLFEKINDGFDFRGSWPRIPLTVRDMDRQLTHYDPTEREEADSE